MDNGHRHRCAANVTVETDSNEDLKPSKKWSTERMNRVGPGEPPGRGPAGGHGLDL